MEDRIATLESALRAEEERLQWLREPFFAITPVTLHLHTTPMAPCPVWAGSSDAWRS
jgi:hypothetical protein